MRDDLEAIELETLLLGRHLAPLRRLPDGEQVLERSAYTLLTRLQTEGPMSIRELSDAFGLDASTLNRQTAAMLRDGLVDRIPDPDGGLARKFQITEMGIRRMSAERGSNVEGLGRVLNGWSEDDVRLFADLLRRFNSSIEQRTQRPWPRG